ncbi:hypothetical protein RFI_25701, partial [Reticulomyxa filosa]
MYDCSVSIAMIESIIYFLPDIFATYVDLLEGCQGNDGIISELHTLVKNEKKNTILNDSICLLLKHFILFSPDLSLGLCDLFQVVPNFLDDSNSYKTPQQIPWKGIEDLKQSLACVIGLPVFSKPRESQKASSTVSNTNEHATIPNSNTNDNSKSNLNPSPVDNTDTKLKQKSEDPILNEGTKITAEQSLETHDKEKEEK